MERLSDSLSVQDCNKKFGYLFDNNCCTREVAEKLLDANYIVDALEDEHTKRDVHTTKIIEYSSGDDDLNCSPQRQDSPDRASRVGNEINVLSRQSP